MTSSHETSARCRSIRAFTGIDLSILLIRGEEGEERRGIERGKEEEEEGREVDVPTREVVEREGNDVSLFEQVVVQCWCAEGTSVRSVKREMKR